MQSVEVVRAKALIVPADIYLTLHSLASSAVPSDYIIIPGEGCIGKVDIYRGEQMRWWICEREGWIEIMTPDGEVVAVVGADYRLAVLGVEVGPLDVVAALGLRYAPVYGHQVVMAVRAVRKWVKDIYPLEP